MSSQFTFMINEQLYNELGVCERSMNSLVTPQTSQVPFEDRREYRQYQRTVSAIEVLLAERHIPSIAEQDTTHYVM